MADLKPKVTLKAKNDTAQTLANNIDAKLVWKTPVDLDLWCGYESKEGGGGGGIFSRLSGGKEGWIGFNNMGDLGSFPFIKLDQDSGVGDSGGDNEENIHFSDLDKHKKLLICANIYNKKTNFAQYSGKVIIKADSEEIEVPLDATEEGSWAVIASVTESPMGGHEVKMINTVTSSKPKLSDF